jgi:hypothetical protein
VGTDLGQVFDLNWCYQFVHEDDRQRIEQIIMVRALIRRIPAEGLGYRIFMKEPGFIMEMWPSKPHPDMVVALSLKFRLNPDNEY